MPSFSVRCIFQWAKRPNQRLQNLYEERITIWKAEELDEALQLAEAEANEYASDGDSYLGLAQAYALYDDIDAQGIEVFSLLRESNLEPNEYLSSFFDSGA